MPHNLCCSSKGGDSFFSASAVNQYAPNKVIEPIHLDINVHFEDLTKKSFTGKVTVTFKHTGKALVSSPKDLSKILLNAEDFENVNVTGDGLKDFHYDGHHIHLFWQQAFAKQEERKVTIEYTIESPTAGLYFNKDDENLNATPVWAITDHETEKARYWLPTVDFPTVRTKLSWTITAPKQYTSLANGTLTSTETSDNFTTTKWELDHPCPSYLICFAVGEFIEVDDGEVDGKPIKYYTAKGYAKEDLKRSFDQTPKMIRWLQNKLGVPFPWTKYYQIALPAIRGAMENISLVTWVEVLLLDETLALERKLIVDTVNIHEMGHTYFGDLLVIRHFEHAWLKESWATYIESCWLQDNASEDEFRYEMLQNSTSYINECGSYMRPIVTRKYDASWDMFDMHTYPGGAWRIHMLRKRLGEEVFWHAIQIYIERFYNKTVQTSDFQNVLEEVSGLNLTRFFDEWLYSKGYPKLSGKYEYEADKNRVKISIAQTQVNAAEQIPLFAFDLDVVITTDKEEKASTTLTFDRDDSATGFIHLPEGQKPSQISIDPEGKVLFAIEMPSIDRDVLIGTAKHSKNLIDRIMAYSELISSGSRPALKAVHEAILKEPFYGVRVKCANQLAKQNSAYSLQILTELLDNEKDPMALEHIAASAKAVDDRIRASLLRLLKRENLPYRAHCNALISLGSQRNPEDLEYLLQVAKDDSKLGQHGIIRSGALKALGQHRSEEAFRYLLGRVHYKQEHFRARPFALQGLIYSAEWQTKRLKNEAVEALETLIRDPNSSVRRVAVAGLVKMNVTSKYGQIATTKSMYSTDEQAWIDRKLVELRSSGSNGSQKEINAQKETIDKLETRVKKLEEKLALQELEENASK
ncbi:Glutamyl aminopeptidase [Choanephora cucurbitarum]|uniref:Glutamyl aminopeptidase n=1 Tax=Choanephora cucurbitarum TaxID=101091 RepID=A0A1C7N599_9FUNG|nr:Glutamyl aminopeptidase [Choanephora cucurbitarum]